MDGYDCGKTLCEKLFKDLGNPDYCALISESCGSSEFEFAEAIIPSTTICTPQLQIENVL